MFRGIRSITGSNITLYGEACRELDKKHVYLLDSLLNDDRTLYINHIRPMLHKKYNMFDMKELTEFNRLYRIMQLYIKRVNAYSTSLIYNRRGKIMRITDLPIIDK